MTTNNDEYEQHFISFVEDRLDRLASYYEDYYKLLYSGVTSEDTKAIKSLLGLTEYRKATKAELIRAVREYMAGDTIKILPSFMR